MKIIKKSFLVLIVILYCFPCSLFAQGDQYWVRYNQEDEAVKGTDVTGCIQHTITTNADAAATQITTSPCTFDLDIVVKLSDDSDGSQKIPSTLHLSLELRNSATNALVATSTVDPVTGAAHMQDIPGRQDYILVLQHTGQIWGTLHDGTAIANKITNPSSSVTPDKLREMDMDKDGDVDTNDLQDFMNKTYNGSNVLYQLTDYELKLSTYSYVDPLQPFEILTTGYPDLQKDHTDTYFLLVRGNPHR